MNKLESLKSDIGLAGVYAVQKMVDLRGAEALVPADFDGVFDEQVRATVEAMNFDERLEVLLLGPERENVVLAGTASAPTLGQAVEVAVTHLLRTKVSAMRDTMLLHFFEGRVGPVVDKAYAIVADTPREFHMRDMGDAPQRMKGLLERFHGGALSQDELADLFALPAMVIEDSVQRQDDFAEMGRLVALLTGLAGLARSGRVADLWKQVKDELAVPMAA